MDAQAEELLDGEEFAVWVNRYTEAREAGLPHLEACLYAWGTYDTGKFRALVDHHCPPELIARIVL